MRNDDRFQSLRGLAPVEAAKAWLEGEFGIYDEQALIEAIRKDKRIKLSDEKITEFFYQALSLEIQDAQRCLEELASRST